MIDLRSVFQPARPTASPDTDRRTRAAYAICRRTLKGKACACEYSGRTGDDICPERMLASLDADTGEG